MRRSLRFRIAPLVLAVLAVLTTAPPLFAADASSPLAQRPEVAAALEVFDTWVDWTVRNREQPAASIGIVYDQELVFAKGYGFADVAKKIPATPATAYRIASISKTFTAHAILQLRDAGKLQLDDPITKWIPELKLAKIDPQSPVITIRQLLSHTGGIPREVDGTYWNDMNFPTREAMLPVLNRMGVVLPPETEWKYSNVALGLAGYIVEAASGEPYPEYVARHILGPLGMNGTRVIPPRDMPTLAVGYGRRMAGKPRRLEPFFSGNYMLAASNLASTVEDLAKYVSLQFRRGPAGGAQILKGTTLAEMQRVQWLQPDWKSGWGLGWGDRPARRHDAHRPRRLRPGPPHSDLVRPEGKVRGHRADELRRRPNFALRQPGVCDRRARHREGGCGRDEDPGGRTPRGASTKASTSGRMRRSTSPFWTGSSRCSTRPRTIPGKRA